MEDLLYLVPLIPLIGFVFNGLFGAKLPKSVVGGIATSAVVASFVLSVSLFFNMPESGFVQNLFTWFSAGNVHADFSFTVDHLSIVMMLIITGIGSLIHLYSIGYMHDDEGFHKFFAYLNLFIFSMLLLVMGSNFLILFIGWEGVGLCSFLLIGFWYTNPEYTYAARKAFIMNRIGDLGLLLGIFLLAYYVGSVDFVVIAQKVSSFKLNDPILIAATVCLFIGAMGKSAQIPLYTWLPDAMAGPTPVSALIHAATMVTAGVYMIVRSNALFSMTPTTLSFVSFIGIATSLVAGFIALRQNDIKKVLAYSTVSQLGFMFAVLGVGAYTTGMFHLMTHAFFKALLFLGSGSVIHALHGEQDMRFMGGLGKKIRFTYAIFWVGTLAICGFPFFSGMVSKDEILTNLYVHNPLMFYLMLVSAAMTCLYMFRLMFLTFYGEFRGDKHTEEKIHESGLSMTIPLGILALLATFGGMFNLPEWMEKLGLGTQKLAHWLSPIYSKHVAEHHISVTTEIMLVVVPVVVLLLCFAYTYSKYVLKKQVAQPIEELTGWEKLSAHKLYVDELYDAIIVKPIKHLGNFAHNLDNLVVDGIVEGIVKRVGGSGQFVRRIQNGNVEVYLFAMSIGIFLILVLNFIF